MALVLGTVAAAPAVAQPTSAQPAAAEFETYCTPSDPDLGELSGLTEVDGVLYGVGDSGTDHRVAVLDASCAVDRWLNVPVDPFDVEDLASHGGDLWLADIGDNQRRRDTVALTRMNTSSGEGELHRLTYPDGPHDAEALLVAPDGVPVIVTKEPSGTSGIYVPADQRSVVELPSPGPTPLTKVGELEFGRTSTPGGPPFITGGILATGGAVSADGTVAAVRTYTDAYLFPVADGDVAAALTAEPVVLPLPPRPQGEAVLFDADGALLVASESAGGELPPFERLPGATELVHSAPATGSPGAAAASQESTPSSESPGGRWSFGFIAAAGILVLASIAYTFGRARGR